MCFLILFFINNLKIVKVWRDVQERHQRVQDQLLQGALRIQPLHPIHDRQGDIPPARELLGFHAWSGTRTDIKNVLSFQN